MSKDAVKEMLLADGDSVAFGALCAQKALRNLESHDVAVLLITWVVTDNRRALTEFLRVYPGKLQDAIGESSYDISRVINDSDHVEVRNILSKHLS